MKKSNLNKVNIPNHVAIILDGNGRWAKKRGLPRSVGHQFGANNIFKIANHANKIGIKTLSIYTFSTENFKRPKDEVDYLMNLPHKLMESNKMNDEFNMKLVHVGSKEGLPLKLVELFEKIEDDTKDNKGLQINVCFNYGSYEELNHAITKMIKDGKKEFNKEDIYPYLYVQEPVDLLIRTSGELRLSNFLLYQAGYSEFYFTKKHWPAFKEKDLLKALKNYQKRHRRFGGL